MEGEPVTEEARRRAERCFAVARSTTFDGERDNAVARGIAIADAAGISLDEFDIPGRVKAVPKPPPRSRFAEDLFTRPRSPFYDGTATKDDFDDVLRRFREHMAAAARRAAREERERRQRAEGDPNRSGEAMNRLRADIAVNYLWARGLAVYRAADALDGGRLWVIPDLENDLEYSDEGIVEVAQRRGWDGRDPAAEAEKRGQVHGRHPRFSDPARLDQAIAFLRRKGCLVQAIPDSDYWVVDGETIQSAAVILTAELAGWRS